MDRSKISPGPDAQAPVPQSEPVASTLSPAHQLADKARAIVEDRSATLGDFAIAEDYCKRALTLDHDDAYISAVYAELWCAAPDLPQAHTAMGDYYYRALRDWPRALAEFRAAEAGLPNDADNLSSLAFTERRLGQWPEAIAHFTREVANDPQGGFRWRAFCETLVLLRRFPAVVEAAERGLASHSADSSLLEFQAKALYEMDGDHAAYLTRLAALPSARLDSSELRRIYDLALAKGDLGAADGILADPRLKTLQSEDTAILNPVALHRARLAFTRGQTEDARRFADDAIAYYRTGKWMPRQESWMKMGLAQVHAYAGRGPEALRDAKAAMALEEGHDVLTTIYLRPDLGRVYLALGQREEAWAVLRTLMTGPSKMTPQGFREDPIWSRLKDDPRFEELLKGARAL